MKKKITLLLSIVCLFLVCSQQLKSQSAVHGIIKNASGKLLQYANVQLLKSADSSLVTGMISDASGKYSFENIRNGKYLVTATFAGLNQMFTNAFEIIADKKEINAGTLYLKNAEVQLKNIMIAFKKPMFEQKIDRMVVNVQSSITSSGSSVLEVLKKSPGVVVNKQNNTITMNGKSGVQVMLNGKLIQLPADAVVQMLEGMSSSNIEKIELITTPPAKYDAEGNGGIIQIITKENTDIGTNGSFGLTLGYKWAETLGGNFNLSHRNKKFAWFLDYSILRNHNLHLSNMTRRSPDSGFIKTASDYSHRENITTQQNLSAGLEWKVNNNTSLNLGLTGYRRNWNMTAFSNDKNHFARDSNVITDIKIHESNIWQSASGAIGLQTKINAKSDVSFNVDYLYYHNNNPSTYDNNFMHVQSSTDEISKTDLKKTTPIRVLVGKADYQHNFSSSFSMEAGIKGVTSNLTNNVLVQQLVNNKWTPDPFFTSLSILSEQIEGAYVSTKWKAGGQWQINTGLRYEYTHTAISSPFKKNLINRKYGYLFPGVFVKKDLKNGKDLQFSYSRRITRPTYNDIAPYVFFWGPKTFSSGNTSLKPAIADAIKAGYHVKKWIVSLQFGHTQNEIYSFQPEKDSLSDNLVYRSQNLKYLNTAGLTNSYSFNMSKWWKVQSNMTAQYQIAQASAQQKNARLHQYNFTINLVNTLILPKDFSVEISGMYQSKSIFGISEFLPQSSLNAGIQKKLGEKGTVRFAMDDILYKDLWRIKTNSPQNNFTSYFNYDLHNQFARLTYTRNLGNNKLRSVKLKSGSEEERGRVTN